MTMVPVPFSQTMTAIKWPLYLEWSSQTTPMNSCLFLYPKWAPECVFRALSWTKTETETLLTNRTPQLSNFQQNTNDPVYLNFLVIGKNTKELKILNFEDIIFGFWKQIIGGTDASIHSESYVYANDNLRTIICHTIAINIRSFQKKFLANGLSKIYAVHLPYFKRSGKWGILRNLLLWCILPLFT